MPAPDMGINIQNYLDFLEDFFGVREPEASDPSIVGLVPGRWSHPLRSFALRFNGLLSIISETSDLAKGSEQSLRISPNKGKRNIVERRWILRSSLHLSRLRL
jgi:hypothetical protein